MNLTPLHGYLSAFFNNFLALSAFDSMTEIVVPLSSLNTQCIPPLPNNSLTISASIWFVGRHISVNCSLLLMVPHSTGLSLHDKLRIQRTCQQFLISVWFYHTPNIRSEAFDQEHRQCVVPSSLDPSTVSYPTLRGEAMGDNTWVEKIAMNFFLP